jgi:hypothetical protein
MRKKFTLCLIIMLILIIEGAFVTISIHFVENRSNVNRTNSITDYANIKRKFN